jgi:GTPase SAR1 family protein
MPGKSKEKKKIILIGPPESGKTTLTQVFFMNRNPLILLKDPLEPTRGVKTNLFSLFKKRLGVFDLAGQENDSWFNQDKEILKNADIIICVFDIRNSVENIVSFLLRVLKIINELESSFTGQLFALIHKIDLANERYLLLKSKHIEDFFREQTPYPQGIRFLGTSIKKKYFFDTYHKIINILKVSLKNDILPISNLEFENLRKELEILLLFKLNRLKKLGFIHIRSKKNKIELSNRGEFLRKNLTQEISRVGLRKENRAIEILFSALNLEVIRV